MIVMPVPIIPNIQHMNNDSLLPIFIKIPPLTAPIVIPKTTDEPKIASFYEAFSGSSFQLNFTDKHYVSGLE